MRRVAFLRSFSCGECGGGGGLARDLGVKAKYVPLFKNGVARAWGEGRGRQGGGGGRRCVFCPHRSAGAGEAGWWVMAGGGLVRDLVAKVKCILLIFSMRARAWGGGAEEVWWGRRSGGVERFAAGAAASVPGTAWERREGARFAAGMAAAGDFGAAGRLRGLGICLDEVVFWGGDASGLGLETRGRDFFSLHRFENVLS